MGENMAQIIRYVFRMLPYMLGALPLIFVFRFISFRKLKKANLMTSPHHEMGVCLFLMFMVGLLSQTIFSELGKAAGQGSINLIPFKILTDTYTEVFINKNIAYLIISFTGNIVMFLPLGFFPPLLWNGKPLQKAILTGFITSLAIELCQIPLGRGTDIDDLILNTLGAFLGYLIYLLLQKLKPSFTAKFKVK